MQRSSQGGHIREIQDKLHFYYNSKTKIQPGSHDPHDPRLPDPPLVENWAGIGIENKNEIGLQSRTVVENEIRFVVEMNRAARKGVPSSELLPCDSAVRATFRPLSELPALPLYVQTDHLVLKSCFKRACESILVYNH
ncbi:hypothetical protein EVAR_50014_1 [Eumeta japonica]|uniref:Uncharacterized protein n=1 Tax=Eumeta variegata TaxID=151549 RepID=A0A4C1XSP6_EUMVA|nr:hypothetical protein EVAR_50014_1 [Eumeta japonica]